MKHPHTACVRRTDVQRATKRLFQQALAILPGVSAATVADALDETESLVEGWASPHRLNHVPAWILAHPKLPADVRAFIDAGLRAMSEATPCRDSSPEVQHQITTGAFGEMLAVVARALVGDNVIDPKEAREALPYALRAYRLLGLSIKALEQRAGVVATGDA